MRFGSHSKSFLCDNDQWLRWFCLALDLIHHLVQPWKPVGLERLLHCVQPSVFSHGRHVVKRLLHCMLQHSAALLLILHTSLPLHVMMCNCVKQLSLE